MQGRSVHLKPEVRSVVEKDGAVLMDTAGGMYYGINAVGARIWAALEAGRNLEEVRDDLVGAYDLEDDFARREIDGFLDTLDNLGLADVRSA